MTKISKKSEKTNPFGGIFHVREQFSRHVGPIIHINFYVIAFFLSPPPQTKKAPPRGLFFGHSFRFWSFIRSVSLGSCARFV